MSQASWIGALSLVATLVAAAPSIAADRDVSELFDPAVLTREICGRDVATDAPSEFTQLAALPTRDPPGTRPPLWPGLGSWSFKISSSVPETQAYFDQGLRLTYGFNHGEAIRAYRAAQEIDPRCAICFWGEALALGPNINEPMTSDANKLALKAIAQANKLMGYAAPKEQALIEALTTRYAKSKKAKRDELDAAYTEAMAKVHAAYPDDVDIATFFADAVLNSTPRPWWQKDGRTPLGRTAEAVAALEGALAAHPEHPGAVHLYIHIMEPSATPEKAEHAADTLAKLMPGAGHMVHMPSHIYFRIGRYKDSIATNIAAVAADEALLAQTPNATERYRHGYYPHNIHMAMASADMAGDAATALKMSDKLIASLAGGKFREEMYTAAALNPHVRFDAPDKILALPKPSKKMPLATGMWLYARASAFAWQKDVANARAEADALTKLRTGHKMKKKDYARGRMQLEIADHVARARIAIAEGDAAAARTELEAAIAIGDPNGFWRGDPPGWDFPIRQALGILLLQTGHAAEAAPVLREALMDAPNNAWVLFALQRASVLTGDTLGAQEYGKLFARAWAGSAPPDLGRI